MVKINLLPYHQQKKVEGSLKKLIIGISAVTAIILIVGGVQLYLILQVGSLEEKLKSEEERLAALTKIAGEINQVNIDKKTVEKKLQIIKALEENRIKPVIMLDYLTSAIPTGQIWLTSLTSSAENYKLEGVARDNADIARYMSNLERTTKFASVDLMTSKQSLIGNTKLQAFSLSCVLKPSPESVQAAEPDKDKAQAKGPGK